MTTRYHKLVDGECYHIYNRGNEKRMIFLDDEDRQKFITLLKYCNYKKKVKLRDRLRTKTHRVALGVDSKLVSIGAYVLMGNHFHILLKQVTDDGIYKFMLKVSTGYVMYFNKKYNRTGGLFEGRYKSEHVNNDNYLKYLSSYIHLNPLKLRDKNWKENKSKLNNSKNFNFLEEYVYSSFIDYLLPGTRQEEKILAKNDFPEYFKNSKDFKDEIFDWIKQTIYTG